MFRSSDRLAFATNLGIGLLVGVLLWLVVRILGQVAYEVSSGVMQRIFEIAGVMLG